MRGAFVAELTLLAREDKRVVLLTGDLGFMVLDDFAREFPGRFYNMGVAEANMLGVAAGLAAQGFLPFCYSIATFASMRGYEQLRDGGHLHSTPVRIIGVGGGFAYGIAGATHWALEDLAIMRAQPRMTVIAPGDDGQARAALRASYATPGPVYYRLGKDSIDIAELESRFLGPEPILLRRGRGTALVTTGGMTAPCLAAADLARARGASVTVISVPQLAPFDDQRLAQLLKGHSLVISVEDHYRAGGLGSLVAETIADLGVGARLIRAGVPSLTSGRSGSEQYMREQCGLAPTQIAKRIPAVVPVVAA